MAIRRGEGRDHLILSRKLESASYLYISGSLLRGQGREGGSHGRTVEGLSVRRRECGKLGITLSPLSCRAGHPANS